MCNLINQVMLMNPEWSESQESCVVLQETPACVAIFGDFIRYFYTGQIRINHLRVMPILALADKYNVKVGNVCQSVMAEYILSAKQCYILQSRIKKMHVCRKQNKEIKETTSSEKNEILVLWQVPCFMSLVTVKNN